MSTIANLMSSSRIRNDASAPRSSGTSRIRPLTTFASPRTRSRYVCTELVTGGGATGPSGAAARNTAATARSVSASDPSCAKMLGPAEVGSSVFALVGLTPIRLMIRSSVSTMWRIWTKRYGKVTPLIVPPTKPPKKPPRKRPAPPITPASMSPIPGPEVRSLMLTT
jgi:hypothetical protein